MNALFDEVRKHIAGHPGGAELDADVHGFNVGRNSGGKGLHIGVVLRVFRCRCQGSPVLFAHIAGEIFVADFPFRTGRIAENQALILQFLLNGLRWPVQQLIHAGKVHLARFSQGDDQSVLGGFGLFRSLCGLEHPLPKDGRFPR